MNKIVRRLSDRRSKHENSDTQNRPNFMKSWSLRRKSKTRSQLLTAETHFIDHPPIPTSEIDISSKHKHSGPARSKPLNSAKSSEQSGPARSKTLNSAKSSEQFVESVDISNENLEHRNGGLSVRLSGNRLSTELSTLSLDKELNETMEQEFKNNFLCLKSEEHQSAVLLCNYLQPVVSTFKSTFSIVY